MDKCPLRACYRMKVITSLFFLVVCCWTYHLAHAQPKPSPLADYAFLRRIHVREAVVNCIAAFDQWVRTGQRYDSIIVSAGNALHARVLPGRGAQESGQSATLDATVDMPAVAKLRQKYVWIPVTASCGVWKKHVVSFSLRPRERRP
ncbi:BspC domain-containing protein [Paraburkholderia sp. Kb1A]